MASCFATKNYVGWGAEGRTRSSRLRPKKNIHSPEYSIVNETASGDSDTASDSSSTGSTGYSDTASDSSSTGSTVRLLVGGAIGSVAGPAVSERSAALGATVGGAIAVKKRSRSPRGRGDDTAEIQSGKRKKGEESTISPYGDTWDTAKRHVAACGDRSGQPPNDTINTLERSQDNFMRESPRSSKKNKSGNQVSCSEEGNGCLFEKLSGIKCNWAGSQSDLVDHSKEHNVKIQEKPGPLKVKLLKFSEARNFSKAIVLWGKLFYILWVKTEDTMHFLVYVTPKKASEEYTYDFKIKNGETEMSISGGKCSSLLQPQSEGIEKGDIISLPCGKVQHYLDTEDNLFCVIEIRRQ